jgi:outer membrane biosynthesis protein TonB
MSEQNNEQRVRVLRIGVIRGGKLAEEHKVRPGKSVTVGDGAKATVAVDGLPKRITLFQPQGDGYRLAFTSGMSGKVATDAGIQSLKELAAEGGEGEVHYLDLKHPNRGKVVIGDVTILFQFVPAPVESVRKVTRHDFRPKLLNDDDPIFIGLLSLWSTVGAVMLVYAANTEPIETVSLDELPDRFVEIVIPEKRDAPEPVETPEGPEVETTETKKEEPKKEEPKKEEPPPKAKNEQEARENDARRLEKKRENLASKSAVLAMIGTRGANNSGSTVADVFSDSDATLNDVDAALQGATVAEAAGSDPKGLKGSGDGGGREDASVGVDGGSGGGKSATVEKVKSTAPKGRASVGKVEAYDGEGADAVRGALKKYNGQLKACYESRLKQNPNISGRVVLEIDVAGGKVATASIVENSTGDSALGSCISKRARGWVLPSSTEGLFAFPLTFEGS